MHLHLVPLEARPGPLKTPRYFNANVSVCGDIPVQVHKIGCLFVYLAGCIDCERHFPQAFGWQAHILCFRVRDRKRERQAHSHDHRHHPLQPF